MHVIEQFLRSRNGSLDGGDDRIVITEHFAAVLDGVTSKSELIDSSIATQVTQEVIERLLPGVTLRHLANEVTDRLGTFLENLALPMLTGEPTNRSSTTLAAYSRARREIWLIGDSQARFGGEVYKDDKEIDRITAEVRALWITLQRLAGKSDDELMEDCPGRRFIMPLLRQQNWLRALPADHALSFGVIDGHPVADEHLRVIPVPRNVREIILATDGYPVIFDTLAQTEIALKEALAEDPLCVDRLRGPKPLQRGSESFDDRAYLRIDVSD